MTAREIPHVLVGGRRVGLGEPCYVIAEAGSNHDRRLEQAYRLIDVAAEAGADAVKFQTFRADKLYPPGAGRSDYLGDERSIDDIIRSMEMPPEWLPKLAEHCRRRGVAFLASAFDEASVDAIDPYVGAHKCASYEMTHTPLLQHMARKGKPLLVSTGTARMDEVEEAVRAVRETGNEALVLLQCTAAYPAPLESLNVRALVTLRETFGVLTGLSDHSREPLVGPMAAAALSAAVLEKHFTLSNRLPGPDHPFAVEPEELAELVRRVREVEGALGTGRKEVHPVELELRGFARRTVFTTRPVAAGEAFTKENVAVLRAGRLGHGLPPAAYPRLLGRRARGPVPAHRPVRPDDVEGAFEAEGPAAPAVSLRRAREDDAVSVWRWNGAPDARAASLRPEPIPLEGHMAWFSGKLADPEAALWVVELEGAPVGTVRIERADGHAAISIAIEQGARGRGVGPRAIELACRAHRGDEPVEASILPDNVRSARAFLAAGFAPAGERTVEGRRVLVYAWRRSRRPPSA